MKRLSPNDSRQLAIRLKRWSQSTGVHSANEVVNDLADVCVAASVVLEIVSTLDPENPLSKDALAKRLVELHTWLYTELQPNVTTLERPLQEVIDAVYASNR